MWVWVAMRCFFEVDCTSSILIAATSPAAAAAAAGYALCVCLELLSPAATNWDRAEAGTGTPLRLVSCGRCAAASSGSRGVSGWAALGCYKAVGELWLGLSAYF